MAKPHSWVKSSYSPYDGYKGPVYIRTIVERAPNHDTSKPCFTAWEFPVSEPDVEAFPQDRPKWSIQMYDTTPEAGDEDHIRALVKKIHEETLYARGGMGRNTPDRIDMYGMPMPVETPEEERVAWCVAHQKAEIAARNATGNGDFFIPPTFGDRYNRIIMIIDKPQEMWDGDEDEGGFISVEFDKVPDPEYDEPDPRAIRMQGSWLYKDGLWGFRECVEWFNNTYVEDGVVDEDILTRT